MKKKFNHNKLPIIGLIIIVLLSIILTPFIKGESIYTKTKNILISKIEYLSLSEERQEAYDKMKIEYVNIKNRVTGTAPFNTGNDSNANGIDVSETDEYVRTFDVMKYTVELGISPNTEHDGVSTSSIYEGGVIKVRAKLPNQGTPTLMRWEQDAWMQNVEYSNDNTEIYAEYHIPKGVSVTNANQNLTFTVKVDGYKKRVTSDMAPEFEVWMEGNKPDDSTSKAESISQKDTRATVISGKVSLDATVLDSTYVYSGNVNNKKGHYITYGLGISLYQPVSVFSDLRGVEYPNGEITVDLKSKYQARNITLGTDYIEIDENNSDGVLNNTSLVAYSVNGINNNDYYPTSRVYTRNLPYGSGGNAYSTVSSGTMTYTMNGVSSQMKFNDYKVEGPYPTRNVVATTSTINYSSKIGHFAEGNVQLFVPYYDNDSREEYDYNFQINIEDIKYKDTNGESYNIQASNLVNRNNKSVSIGFTKRVTGNFYVATMLTSNNGESRDGLASGYLEQTITPTFTLMPVDGPYEGGAERFITWDNNYFSYIEKSLSTFCSTELGFPMPDNSTISFQYGVYKENKANGIRGDTAINAATKDQFDWYETEEEAIREGRISAIYGFDNEVVGNRVHRQIRMNLKVTNDNQYLGSVGAIIHRTKIYGDTDKTQVFAPYSSLNYQKTIYNANGTVASTHSPYNIGASLLILGVKSSLTTTVEDEDSQGNPKNAYDVQDGEIRLKVSPMITNGKAASSEDSYVSSVVIRSTLPSGLSYKKESANKTPESVVVNADGTTITWKYTNWQINHPAPELPEITYKAEISASLTNNTSLEVKSTIYTNQDLRDEEQYRTSKYGVVISNLAGSKALKEIDKPVIEKDESFLVTSTLGNNSEETLRNVKTIEILPTDNDENGSKFSGNYTSKVTSGITGQKFFYTTGVISSIGLTEDKYGKLTIKDVDLENDSRWTEVSIGNVIPSNATAVATLLPELPSKSEENFVMQFISAGNKEADRYAFTLNMTSDNLQAAIKTNTVVTQVVSRSLSGKAFIDENRNGTYDSEDTLLKTSVVKLLNESGVIVKTTQTNQNGEYTFENIEKGNYYVEFTIPTNYEAIPKGNVSKVYPNGKTDKITELNTVPTTSPTIEATGIDMGIRKIDAKIYVRYEEYGNSTNLFDSTEFDKFYGDSYNLDNDYTPTIPDNYEFKEKTNNYTGTVNQKEIHITYYYQKKDSTLTSSITKEGTKEITSREDKVKYKITYKTKITDYLGQATIKITDTLPYEIEEESKLDGGTYDASTKTITWTETKTIQSITEPEITIEKNIEVLYREVDARSREMVNTVEGTTTLDNNERSVQDNEKTDIKIPGTIKVRYIEVDEEGKEIKELDTIEDTDLIGEEYTTEEKEFEGYLLKEKPETEEYEFEEEEQIVIYTYEKTKVKVETVVHGLGGKIAGDEDVNYGEDSTKDRIIIEAEDGYQIETIKINNEEQEIKGVVTRLVLDNFEGMMEDKLIEVTFKKTPKIVNPQTGSTLINLLMILSIASVLISLFYVFNREKKLN